MPAVDTAANVWKVVVAVAGVAILVAQILLQTDDPGGVRQFAIYLVAHTWQEAIVVAVLYSVFWLILKQRKAFPRLARLRRDRAAVASAVCILALGISLLWPLYLFTRARFYFWTHLTRKAYVEEHRAEVHSLLEEGRPAEAFDVATKISGAFKGTPEARYLDTAVRTLQIINERSGQLSQAAPGTAGWNPISQRKLYFQVAESVRLNPQNYGAADILKEMVQKIENGLKIDEASICTSGGNLAAFRGWTTALVEAEARWTEAGSVEACPSVFRRRASSAWQLERARCLIAASDHTRLPAAKRVRGNALLASLPACRPYTDEGGDYLRGERPR